MKCRIVACLLVALSLAACSRKGPEEPPVAGVSVSLASARVPLGSPVEMKYRFVVPAGAQKIPGDFRVFVHFLEAGSREMMWADDHVPPVPTSQWKAGQVVEYTRTMFAPVYPYVGQATIEVGLYSEQGRRLTLSGGTDRGHQSLEVGRFDLLPQTENIFLIYKEGWHPVEGARDAGAEWQWTKKDAVVAFRNPRRDVLVYLHVARPSPDVPPPTVTVMLGEQAVDTFVADGELMRKIQLSAAQLGTGEMIDLKISVDRTFVPALLPASTNRDPRELGIPVFHAFVAPR